MAKLSVIVPIFNTEKYLKQCLDSIVNQTYKDIEIICINDGSTDGSLDILQDYAKKDDRIKIINQNNQGQSVARNNGLAVASGDYITFVDSNDYINVNAYEIALPKIEDVDIVCFGAKVFGNTNAKQKKDDDKYHKIKFKGKLKLNDTVILKTDCSLWNKIFRKEIIDRYKIEFPVGMNYEDAEFYFKYINVINNAYFLDKYFYNYRRRSDSIMGKTFNGCEYAVEHLCLIEHLYDFFVENNLFESKEALFVSIFKDFFGFAYYHSPNELKNEVFLLGKKYANTFPISEKNMNCTIRALKTGTNEDLNKTRFSLLEKIFSIKKDLTRTYKIFTVLGISLKIKRHKKC